MKIRFLRKDDYNDVCRLLRENGVEPPQEQSDLSGFCIVAEDEGAIVGVIWALHGKSTTAYIDYLAVKEDRQSEKIFMKLLNVMDIWLKKNGVKRYYFFVVEHSVRFLKLLLRHMSIYNVKLLGSGEIYLFRREIP